MPEENSTQLALHLESIQQDFIIYEAGNYFDGVTDPQKKNAGVQALVKLLVWLETQSLREFYIEQISKMYKISKRLLAAELSQEMKYRQLDDGEDEGVPVVDFALPEGASREDFEKFGFWEENNTYRFMTKYGVSEGSNFVIKPLFHIYSKTDNKRLIEITNTFGYKKIIDVPSKMAVSLELMQQSVYGEGNYILFCNANQFKKILSKISNEFPVCVELKTLGWQREGFFAFANGIFDGKEFLPVDELGMTDYKNTKYFAPAFSSIYRDVREDDDEYENDRFFIKMDARVSLEEWCKLIVQAYGDNGKFGIAFVVASLFRDLIYEKFKIFPHLFLFGQKSTGKSQLGWSLQGVFLHNLPPFNLSHGTNVGFFRKLARFRNAISWFDEYTNTVKPERLQALKSAYDGVGHEKGKMSKDSRTEITKVNCASVISGQYLPTSDDNALFSRSILLEFYEHVFTEEENAAWDRLKTLEAEGISSILMEILKHRQEIYKKFPLCFTEIFEELKRILVSRGLPLNDRIVRNYSTILAPVKILEEKIDFGFKYDEFYHRAIELCIRQTEQVSLGDSLSTFWNMVSFLIDKDDIKIDKDYKIESYSSISFPRTIKDRNGNIVSFDQVVDKAFVGQEILRPTKPTLIKVVYLRLGKIHPLYLDAHRKQYGVNGVDMTSITHYLSNHKAYIGFTKNTRFDNVVTSGYVFDYGVLDIDLERLPIDGGSNIEKPEKAEENLPF